jgi:hypothetical protein
MLTGELINVKVRPSNTRIRVRVHFAIRRKTR